MSCLRPEYNLLSAGGDGWMSSPRLDELLLLKGGATHLLWTSVSPEAGQLAFSDNLDALVSTLFKHWWVSSHSCPLTRKSKSKPASLACFLVERWEREKRKKCSAVLKKFQQSWRGVLEPRSRVRGVLFPRTGLSVCLSIPAMLSHWLRAAHGKCDLLANTMTDFRGQ